MRTICCYEDRSRDLVGVQLLVLSLRRHQPSWRVRVACPAATPELASFLAAQREVELIRLATPASGWNVKPHLLLAMLDAGASEAIWIDSDIIVHRDPAPLLDGLPDDVLVCTQERPFTHLQGGTELTRRWGLEVGRALPMTVNSCVLRVTPAHRPLLEAWAAALADPAYAAAQRAPVEERPQHLLSDQDVLGALLGARRFAGVPLRFLRRGRDIAQAFHADGYTLGDRLRNLGRGLPPFVHAQGPKPWDLRARAAQPYLAVSPYLWAARQWRQALEPAQAGWLDPLPGEPATPYQGAPNLFGLQTAAARQLRRVGVRSTLRRVLGKGGV